MANPYSALGQRAFWKAAVAERPSPGFAEIYKKKFQITEQDRVVTAGSCFAQHITQAMKQSGFNFCDYEPAPSMMNSSSWSRYSYGIYSARYGNIYTAIQLLQTFERAFGVRAPREPAWLLGDGFVDPFRPALEPVPFISEAEMLASRVSHLRKVRQVFEECDVFVFTLGLTEAWVSRDDGSAFPLCPGTAGGTFDAEKYTFCNFTSAQIYTDLLQFIRSLRAINPDVRILLTVSPVSLVATASGHHVLSATTYSKSALRAAAGEIAAQDSAVDYFPSYELIATSPLRGQYFEADMRSVSPHGVKFVMSHFFAEHRPIGILAAPDNESMRLENIAEPDEVICEEVLLESHI